VTEFHGLLRGAAVSGRWLLVSGGVALEAASNQGPETGSGSRQNDRAICVTAAPAGCFCLGKAETATLASPP
jgi:hypothetical protein